MRIKELFRDADENSFVSLRTFPHDRGKPPLAIEGIKVSDPHLIDKIEAAAIRAARASNPAVFAPPIATFNNPTRATHSDLTNGLAIAIELDEGDTGKKLGELEYLVGPATVVVQSGGMWTDPATKKKFAKLHVYWRLSEPTRDLSSHNLLGLARHDAALLAGADPSGASPVHPFRWPGSVHTKDPAHPVLCRIERINEQAEVHLEDAAQKLNEAVHALGLGSTRGDGQDQTDQHPPVELIVLASALDAIPVEGMSHIQWVIIGMAIHNATGGSDAGLKLFDAFSQRSPGDYDRKGLEAQWRSFAHKPYGKPLRTAGTIFYYAQQQGWQFPPEEEPEPEPEPEPKPDPDTKPAAEPKAADNIRSWPEMDADAFHGLAGEVVYAIAPTTEADPVGLLAHFLVAFGNAIGRKPYCVADGARHYPNEYAVMVGVTSKGRKGTTARRIDQFMSAAASDWHLDCVASGLSSGEGVIHAVRDEVRGYEKTGKGKQIEYIEVVKDLGEADKRLLIHEAEFGGALEVMKRQGSTLSRVIREAYDTGDLRVLVKNNAERATGAHISILGHITVDEYRVSLDRISMVNGYANRFLNFLVKRVQELPFGRLLDAAVMTPLVHRIRRALDNQALWREITFSREAAEMWVAGYHDLSAAKPGLYGSVVARGEAHALRLALIYALLDERLQIEPPHLQAALAVWRYCEASARFIFGDALGDPIADEILRALRRAGPDGLTRWDISNLFGRNLSSDRLGKALVLLEEHGKARRTMRGGGPGQGRPTEIWKAV